MPKYKIVHLITSLKVGGAETVLYDLVRKLDTNLFDNYVIYFHDGPNVTRLNKCGIKTFQIKGLICKYDPIFLFRLFKLIRKIKPDCIHSSLWSANVLGIIIARLIKVPIACALHLATNFESTGTNSFFRTSIDKIILPLANRIIAVSNDMVNDLKNLNWFPFNKLQVISNGIDINYIKQQAQISSYNRSTYKIKDDCFVIGTVGRFIPRKNQQLLIESFALLSKTCANIHLFLIGYGPLEDQLKLKVNALNIGDKVTFLKTDQAYGFYPLFDCFVLTSDNESFGLVTLEAMVFSLPCVVTNYNLNHQIITNGVDGYVVKPGESVSLYNKLKELYNNRNTCADLGLKAEQKVLSSFNLNVTVSNYSQLFEKLILENSKR